MTDIQFWVAGEWTMVYEDGRLVRAGDSYLADEWLQERFGVTVIQDDASVCIPDGHNALKTLAEAEAAMEAHALRLKDAQQKRDLAATLLAEASALEGQK